MSLQFLLDGYNIIPQMPAVDQLSHVEQMAALVEFVDSRKLHGSDNNKVTVVFDGTAVKYQHPVNSLVKVLFSARESADDKIKKIVNEAAHKKNIVVVTNDRAIQYSVRASGAKVMSVEQFLAKRKNSHQSPQRSNNQTALSDKNIPVNKEQKITAEMEGIWLKKERRKNKP